MPSIFGPTSRATRNNLAALMVEAGQPQEAFRQLRAVYDEPVAHYNLGFLLNKRGLKPAALQEFSTALQMSPGMGLARQWVERLSKEQSEHEATAMSVMPQRPAAVMVVPGPSYPRDYAPCRPRRSRLSTLRRRNIAHRAPRLPKSSTRPRSRNTRPRQMPRR